MKDEALKITGQFRIITTDSKTGKVLRISEWMKNLIVSGTNTGRNLIAQRLGGTNTYSANINYADIGTGTATPANSDTTLQTATTRAVRASTSVSNNVLTLQFFFADGVLPNGSYNEFGTFIDGTATISTGQLFNRALFTVAYAKASGEDTTIEVQITIN